MKIGKHILEMPRPSIIVSLSSHCSVYDGYSSLHDSHSYGLKLSMKENKDDDIHLSKITAIVISK